MSREALGLIETKGMLGAIEVTRAATQAAEVSIASAEHTESGRIIVKIGGDWGAVLIAVEAGARAAEQAQQLVSMHIIPRPDESVSLILPYRLFIDRYYPTGDTPHLSKPKPASDQSRSKPPRVSTPAAAKPRPPKPAPKSAAPRVAKTMTPSPTTSPIPTLTPAPRSAPTPYEPPTPAVPQTKPAPPLEQIKPKPIRVATPPSAPAELLSLAEMEAMPVVKLRQYARTIPNLPIQGRQISMANKQQLLEAIKTIL